jgi:hypothetical protein
LDLRGVSFVNMVLGDTYACMAVVHCRLSNTFDVPSKL